MPYESVQEKLDRILADLKSDEPASQLEAIQELGTIEYSSEAILARLEHLAIHGSGEIQNAALAALDLETSQLAAAKSSVLSKTTRRIILAEIAQWQEDGLIEAGRAEVLKRHYDFDTRRGIPIRAAVQQKDQLPTVQPVEMGNPAAALQPADAPYVPAVPAPARPGLMQSLLSEFSIRIYLYLGAFFVIVAAAILAALVEAARLPILLIATLGFAAGAVMIRKRLPQPSFAFAIIFSFLLPIDGVVIADTLDLNPPGRDLFWFFVFLIMAALWAGGTWMYVSRLFSLAAFAAFALSVYRLDLALSASFDWTLFSLGIVAIAGLIESRLLIWWKDRNFALPVFLSAQGLQAFTLAGSLLAIGINSFESTSPDQWIALSLMWLIAAAFYAVSGLVIPFLLFPWAAVGSLFVVPWLFLSAFGASAPAMIAGFWLWGALLGMLSEIAHRAKYEEVRKYHFPLLSLSLPLFFVSILWGYIDNFHLAFGALLGTFVIYAILHAMRPRWYVWSTALTAGLGAYLTFFVLPFMMETFVYFGFQLLIASLLMLIPELFFKGPLTFNRSWSWPPVLFGTALTGFNLLFILTDYASYPANGEKAIIFGAYALLFAAYASRFAQPLIGYLAAASSAIGIAFGLIFLKLDLWLPVLTALSVIYYGAGYLSARSDRGKPWSAMLIQSGLGLGVIISVLAVFMLQPTGGWYALVIAALFAIEMFTRRNDYLELFIPSLSSIALIIVLNDFNIREVAYYLFGLNLVWLTSDAILHLTFKDRKVHVITWLGSGSLTFAAGGAILITGIASGSAAICFAVYTAFFSAYAWVYKQPRLGYLSTAAAAVTMFYALDHFKIETWLPIFTALALIYYGAGFLLRNQSAGWSEMFRFSGLGLGTLIALAALVNVEAAGGWYALILGSLFVVETVSTRNGWFEAGVHILFSIAAFLILRDFNVDQWSFILLAVSLVWLAGDAAFHTWFQDRKVGAQVQTIGLGITLINGLLLALGHSREAAISYGIYAAFLAIYALVRANPALGYLSTVSLPLAVYFTMDSFNAHWWIFPVIVIAALYYAAGYLLRARSTAKGWDGMLLFSGLGLGTITAFLAPSQTGGIEKAIPIAIAATLFAAEAFARRNVWLAFPANVLYLISYFTLLFELNVEEPQYFSIGAAVLGMVMHFLLVRSKSKAGAFIMGTLSQLTLLGTTYIQMVSTEKSAFFFVIFAQSLAVLVYGIIMRSRSLVIAPIGFAVLATVTVLYSALRDLSIVVIVGVTGIVLLSLGIVAVLMRERITTLAERFSDWSA